MLLRWTMLAALVAGAATVTAQDPAPGADAVPQEGPNVTFRVEVNYVEVDARVLDGQGNFIRDLTRDDFEILEDGVAQTVDTFSLVDIPVERPEVPLFATAPIEPDVATNARTFDGRLYLFVLDDLQTSPLRTQQVRNAVRRFIETRLGANDRAAIVTVRGGSRGSQGFTDSRRLLLEAADHFVGQKLQSETLMRLSTPQPAGGVIGPASSDPAEVERAFNADASLQTLRNSAEFLAGVHGRRKALVYVSEGIDYNVYDAISNRNASRVVSSAQDAVAAATRSNVAIYAIDPRGLSSGTEDLIETASQTAELGAQSALREMQVAHDSLRMLADSTGGFAAVNTNDLAGAFDRIVVENSSYYVLGFYPVSDRREGKTRRIQVRVRRPGLQVFARRDYIEPRGRAAADSAPPIAQGTPTALVEAIRSPLPLSGLTFSATAAAFKGTAPRAQVTVVIEAPGDALTFTDEAGTYTGTLELSLAAFDQSGRFKGGERPSVTFAMRPETHARVLETGVRVLSRIALEPGRYQLRIAALSGGSDSRGSVFYDFEVPDFSKGDLTMSGLLLTSMAASQTMTTGADPTLADALPAPPTTLRVFPAGDELALFAEVYDNEVRTPHSVDLVTRVLTDTGRVVFTGSEARSSEELGGRPGGYGYSARVPLTGFEPGLYVLTVEARSRLGRTEPVVRQVQFRVVEGPA
jgi:VWFA-related protein